MTGIDLRESLLAGSSSPTSTSPSRTAASGSDDDTKADRTRQHLPPPAASTPLPVGIAKNVASPPSPSPPAVDNANATKNLSPSRTAAPGSDDNIKVERTRPPVDMVENGTTSSSPSVSDDAIKADPTRQVLPPPAASPPAVDNANATKNLSPSRTAAPGSDDDIKVERTRPPVGMAENGTTSFSPSVSDDAIKVDPTRQVLPPPPASPPLPVGMAKNGSSTPSPSSPAVDNANVAKNPSPPVKSDVDERSADIMKLPGGGTFLDPSIGWLGDPEAQATSLLTSPRDPLLTSSSSSSPLPTSRGWLGLRRRPPALPVTVYAPAPAPGRSFNWFHAWKETNRPRAPRLDSVGVEKVIGVYGFSLFGSISLLPSTMDQVKQQELSEAQKTSLMMVFGSVWVLASVGVHCGLHGKTNFEQAVCRHIGRLGMLGLVLLVIFHIRGALPDGTAYDNACYVLAGFAALLHFGSWAASCIVGEDRMEDAAPAAEDQ